KPETGNRKCQSTEALLFRHDPSVPTHGEGGNAAKCRRTISVGMQSRAQWRMFGIYGSPVPGRYRADGDLLAALTARAQRATWPRNNRRALGLYVRGWRPA